MKSFLFVLSILAITNCPAQANDNKYQIHATQDSDFKKADPVFASNDMKRGNIIKEQSSVKASKYKKSTALMLSVFLGLVGGDRFYVGKIGTGVLKLLTGGGFGIWAAVDFIKLATDNYKDHKGRPVIKG